jgi:hypothetical protein
VTLDGRTLAESWLRDPDASVLLTGCENVTLRLGPQSGQPCQASHRATPP